MTDRKTHLPLKAQQVDIEGDVVYIDGAVTQTERLSVLQAFTFPDGNTGTAWTIEDSEPPCIITAAISTTGARITTDSVTVRGIRLDTMVILNIKPTAGSLTAIDTNNADANGTIDAAAGSIPVRYRPTSTQKGTCMVQYDTAALAPGVMTLQADGSFSVQPFSDGQTAFVSGNPTAWVTGAFFMFIAV